MVAPAELGAQVGSGAFILVTRVRAGSWLPSTAAAVRLTEASGEAVVLYNRNLLTAESGGMETRDGLVRLGQPFVLRGRNLTNAYRSCF